MSQSDEQLHADVKAEVEKAASLTASQVCPWVPANPRALLFYFSPCGETPAQHPPPSPLPPQLAQLKDLSAILAMEHLLAAERAGLLCRDDTVEGLRFFVNRFAS